jgi:heat shock protein HslJ
MSGGEAASLDQITNINWQWTDLQETQPASVSVVPDSGKYLLTLTPDGNFAFTADCNSGSGTYTSEGTNLTHPGSQTRPSAAPNRFPAITSRCWVR